MARYRRTIHQREFRHIMKPPLIALSTLVPTTPLFPTEVCHQPFTDDQWLKHADKGLSTYCKMLPGPVLVVMATKTGGGDSHVTESP
ncbi:hypothetical protein NQZ68_027360 [Dissostichus eleginoides]|nr:hypothetical protein NQZ68_027360 [Dissostichus eleginoides]